MSMTKKTWSINALATEFGLDRRTVGLRIADVTPAGVKHGAPVWHLADVADVLVDRDKRRTAAPSLKNSDPDPEPPKGFGFLRHLDRPFDQGAMAMAGPLLYKSGRIAAVVALEQGASLELAYCISKVTPALLAHTVETIGRDLGVPLFDFEDPAWIEFDCFDEIDWAALAAKHGVEADVDGWEQAYRERAEILNAAAAS